MNKAKKVRKALNMSVEEAGIFFGYPPGKRTAYKAWSRLELTGNWHNTLDRHMDMILCMLKEGENIAIDLLVCRFGAEVKEN